MMHQVDPLYLKAVLFSGRCLVIVKDILSGKALTVRLHSPRNSLTYTVTIDGTRIGYYDFAKSDTLFAYHRGDYSIIQRLVDSALYGSMDPDLRVYHTGSCSYCGRELTDELSIQRGIGPICMGRLAGTIPVLKDWKEPQ